MRLLLRRGAFEDRATKKRALNRLWLRHPHIDGSMAFYRGVSTDLKAFWLQPPYGRLGSGGAGGVEESMRRLAVELADEQDSAACDDSHIPDLPPAHKGRYGYGYRARARERH